jgi:hypothetical protein
VDSWSLKADYKTTMYRKILELRVFKEERNNLSVKTLKSFLFLPCKQAVTVGKKSYFSNRHTAG